LRQFEKLNAENPRKAMGLEWFSIQISILRLRSQI